MQTDRYRVWFLIAAIPLLVALSLGWWAASSTPEPLALIPVLTGEVEYCLTCHADLSEISPSHPVDAFGCVLCHGGERLALDADLAHSSMRGGANPSDLAVVELSCGGSDCHSGSEIDHRDHIQRVSTSIQSTYAGAIANVRYTFGAQPDLDPRYGTVPVQDHSLPTETEILALAEYLPQEESNPILVKFGENCLSCHLNAAPREGVPYQRYTGCAACHTPLTASAQASLASADGEAQVHQLTTAIPYNQCNTCHNRGNYDLGLMEFVERSDAPSARIDDYYQPIAQFTQCEYTLDCIDCHTGGEAMGDGDLHPDQKSIEYVQCKTCHGTLTELPSAYSLTDPDDLAFRLADLNPVVDLALGDTILVTEQGEPLWNTKVLADGSYQLVGKASGQSFYFQPVMGSECEQDPSEQESHYCHQCHEVEH